MDTLPPRGAGDKPRTASRSRPCPVCDGDHKCGIKGDGLILCGRKSGPVAGFVYLGQAKKDSQFALYRHADDPALRQREEERRDAHRGNGAKKQAPPIDWEKRARQYRESLTEERRKELADALGVPGHVLDELHVGYTVQGPHRDKESGKPLGRAWTFPERDAARNIIGITCRYEGGTKKALEGSQRGLIIPDGWQGRGGPVFCVEGPSDVLALTAMSLPAVGRPSCRGGAEHLAGLLRDLPPERPVVILGEYDPKKNGTWPGRDGAAQVSAQLTELLGRKVLWALPPDGAKDVREWFKRQAPDVTCCDEMDVLGDRFAQALDGAYQEAEQDAHGGNGRATADLPPIRPRDWPDPPGEAAYHGPAGELVRLVEPHSEADPVAVLVQTLVMFGSCIGRTAHLRVEADTHHGNLNAVLVGRTSDGRKGTSYGYPRMLFTQVDQAWVDHRVKTGLSSGEGLLYAVCDGKEGGGGEDEEEGDKGEPDKRLLAVEPEFVSVLKHAERQGNILTCQIRQCWDAPKVCSTLVRKNPLRATGAHVSIIGHITDEELRRYLSATEQANGFGNRFLWLAVRRSKCLPEGGNLTPFELDGLVETFRQAVTFAKLQGAVGFDDEARRVWHDIYPRLSAGKPGLSGAMLGRNVAQVRRLALLYTLLDRSETTRVEHLRAALELWGYVERSVLFILGDATGNALADTILQALRGAADQGLSRTAISGLFHRNRGAIEIAGALGLLLSHGLAHPRVTPTAGRDEERWFTGPDLTKERK
jgi:hypothetical protein